MHGTLQPPMPADQGESARIEHTRLRRRILYGEWREDLAARMRRNLGNVRAEAIGEPDMSAAPFEVSCTEAAALYDQVPVQHQADEPSRRAMKAWTDRAMLYPLMSRVQRDALGLREMFVRVAVNRTPGAPEIVYEPVFPDMALVRADPRNPARPIEVREWVERPDPRDPDRQMWTQDLWSADGQPRHMVLDVEGEVDLSAHYGLPDGGLVGDAYPAIRYADGRAILPYGAFHAAVTGRLLDAFYRRELVEGNLNVGVLWTFFTHCVRAASWPQRWISGGQIASAMLEGGIRRIVADPATILEILQDANFEGQVTAGQWGSASDPKAVAEAIMIYEQRFTGYVGVGSEFWRRSNDPRSGLALTLDRTGRIEAQRRFAPIFAPSDGDLLSITATMVNRALGAPVLVEDGWRVEHVSLPPSIDERNASRAEVLELLREGLISRSEARARLLGEDLEQAKRNLPDAPAVAAH